MAQLAVFLFTAALNDYKNRRGTFGSPDRKMIISPGSKRSVEWDHLCVPGLRDPPTKKLALIDDELGILLTTPPGSFILSEIGYIIFLL